MGFIRGEIYDLPFVEDENFSLLSRKGLKNPKYWYFKRFSSSIFSVSSFSVFIFVFYSFRIFFLLKKISIVYKYIEVHFVFLLLKLRNPG